MNDDDFYECGHTFTGQPVCSYGEMILADLHLEWIKIIEEHYKEYVTADRPRLSAVSHLPLGEF
jgi:hypothetical protein